MRAVIDLTDDDPTQGLVKVHYTCGLDGVDDEAADVLPAQKDATTAGMLPSVSHRPRKWRLPDLEEDHMQAVVDLLVVQPETKANDALAISSDAKRKASTILDEPITSRRRKFSKPQTNGMSTPSIAFKPPPTIYIPDTNESPFSPRPTTTTTAPVTPRLTSKRTRQPFPFLSLPPELRNRIYIFLLTTFDPIEITQARQTTQKRVDQFAKCKTSKARRIFKTIFLEILQTSKQVHVEATTILYGNNIFKFRSDHKAGYRDPRNMLPEKYLGLLKRVKVSVISREADNGQDQWVADLLNSTFSREKTRLEMFELTWYGWKKFRLTKEGVVCQALLSLDVEKVFSVKVAGDARMRTEMLQGLTAEVKARKVEIKRPLIEVLKGGVMVEASDEEE